MNLLILVVDDEPDIELLFRQQFKTAHPRHVDVRQDQDDRHTRGVRDA